MRVGPVPVRVLLLSAAALLIVSCAGNTVRFDASPQAEVESRQMVQEAGAFRVAASVPSTEEAERLFGIPLQDRGIQPVWLEIRNDGDDRARFVPYSVDREYFPSHEVAYMFRKGLSDQALADLETHLLEQTLPRRINPNSTVSGYVFTHAEPGTKAFNVDIYYANGEAPNEHFTFFINVPGFEPDHASVDFESLYASEEIADYSVDEFRQALADWPCCTTNHDGSLEGRPYLVFFVAHGKDLLQALLRAEWQETSLSSDPNYLISIDYLFSRPPDARFRKLRDEGSNRNEMALWLAPVRVEGKPVWVAQIKHAISRFFGLGDYFFGQRIDPDVDEGRNFMLQNMWYAQALEAYAFSGTSVVVPVDDPRLDFNGQPWFSDRYRLILWISGDPVSLKSARDMKWDRVIEARSEGQ